MLLSIRILFLISIKNSYNVGQDGHHLFQQSCVYKCSNNIIELIFNLNCNRSRLITRDEYKQPRTEDLVMQRSKHSIICATMYFR